MRQQLMVIRHHVNIDRHFVMKLYQVLPNYTMRCRFVMPTRHYCHTLRPTVVTRLSFRRHFSHDTEQV